VDILFNFVRTATGVLACDRIVIGVPKSGADFDQMRLGVVFRLGRRFGPMSVPHDAEVDPVNTITVLSVSPAEDDHGALEQVFRDSEVTLYPNCRVTLQRCASLASALAAVRENPIPIVLFDGDWHRGAWREMLATVKDLPAPPCVIVTSQLADDRLWAEALSHGAFDVVAKPFNRNDLIRIVTAAWRRWRNRHAQPAAAAGSQGPPAGQ
jgi:CheY-like chemotaxis protein